MNNTWNEVTFEGFETYFGTGLRLTNFTPAKNGDDVTIDEFSAFVVEVNGESIEPFPLVLLNKTPKGFISFPAIPNKEYEERNDTMSVLLLPRVSSFLLELSGKETPPSNSEIESILLKVSIDGSSVSVEVV